MRQMRSATCFHLCVLCCACANFFFELHAQDSATSAAPIIDLFDGHTLEGREGDPAHWRIADGAILGEIAPGQTLNKNTWLVWRDGELTDFELNVQFKLPGFSVTNSGIQIRCRVDNFDHGHGAGGSGKAGSYDVAGGHSHVGTMIYPGDNRPSEYRNHLFTHNFHGHQMNHVINRREAVGYNSVHAGYDTLLCADQQYMGIDLQGGPDGTVCFSDWYDPRHCHYPNMEQWDRGNGRLYRMKFDATSKPISADYTTATDEALVTAQLHPNEWHVRGARLDHRNDRRSSHHRSDREGNGFVNYGTNIDRKRDGG